MTRGWVMGLAGVVLALCFAVSCGEKVSKTASNQPKTQGAPQTQTITYADLSTKVKELVDNFNKQLEQGAANLPEQAKAAGAKIPAKQPPITLMTRMYELRDTGTVLSSAKGGDGMTHVMLDMGGGGNPDVDLSIGTGEPPANGAKVSFTGKIVNAQMKDDKLQLTASGTISK